MITRSLRHSARQGWGLMKTGARADSGQLHRRKGEPIEAILVVQAALRYCSVQRRETSWGNYPVTTGKEIFAIAPSMDRIVDPATLWAIPMHRRRVVEVELTIALGTAPGEQGVIVQQPPLLLSGQSGFV